MFKLLLLVVIIAGIGAIIGRIIAKGTGYTKKCPYCAETIKEDAIVCKHCRRDLPIEMVRGPSRKE